jgi:hypothetical protein
MGKRYIVDFYDMIDGWCHMSEFYGWQYDTLEEAKTVCIDKMDKLDESNKRAGEHYGVIDTTLNREVYCTGEV